MLKKVKATVANRPLPLVLSLLLSSLFFSSVYSPETGDPGHLGRLLKLSGALFLLQLIAFSFLCASVRRHLVHERENLSEGRTGGLLLWVFVLYKEVIKTIFGVSMALGWLAGLLFIVDYFRDYSILVPVLLGIPVSAVAFLPAYLFASFLDHIPYPRRG
jgi:hypothetical protein